MSTLLQQQYKSFLFNELLHAVGKLAVEEGEVWRLEHPELMDAYQACLDAAQQALNEAIEDSPYFDYDKVHGR